MSEEELINKLCNKFVTGDNYDSRYTDDIYNSIIELDQYKNNWEELKKWLEQEWLEWKDCEDARTKNFATEDKIILNKMKELEEKNGKN